MCPRPEQQEEKCRLACAVCGKPMPERGPGAAACVCGDCYRADPEQALKRLKEKGNVPTT